MSGRVPPSSRYGKRSKRKAARSKTGRQMQQAALLYQRFSGHDAEVAARLHLESIGPDDSIVAVLIGTLDAVEYTTVRDGEREMYRHRFAQRDKPQLCVSHDGKRIFVIGGRYRFTARGIVDDSDKSR